MNTFKTTLYRAGLSNPEVEALANAFDRIEAIANGTLPANEDETRLKAVIDGRLAAKTVTEVAWKKLYAFQKYEVAKQLEAELGSYAPDTRKAYRDAAACGSAHAARWLKALQPRPTTMWRNTLWNSPYRVDMVYGSSGGYEYISPQAEGFV